MEEVELLSLYFVYKCKVFLRDGIYMVDFLFIMKKFEEKVEEMMV